MKRFSKYAIAAGSALAIAGLGSSVALADSPGQLGGGPDVFVVKNKTQNGSYGQSASVACNEEARYSIRLHNAAYGGLTNIMVSVNLPNGTMKAVPAEGASQGTSGSVSVSTPSGSTLDYENGSTVLYDVNGNVLKTLPDTITSSGVNVGNLPGSTTEFVNFNAKVNCPTPSPVYNCTNLSVTVGDNRHVNGTVTYVAQNGAVLKNVKWVWGDGNSDNTGTTLTKDHTYATDGNKTISANLTFTVNGSDVTPATPDSCVKTVNVNTPTPPQTPPTQLPNTGAGSVVGIFAGVSALGAGLHYLFTGRRNPFRQ